MWPSGKNISRTINGNPSKYKDTIYENYLTNKMCLEGNEILWSWCISVCPGRFHLLFWETQTLNWKHFADQIDRMLRDMETGHPLKGHLWIMWTRNSEGEEKNPELLWGSDTNRRNCTWRSSNRAPETVRSVKGAGKASQTKQLVWDLKGTE